MKFPKICILFGNNYYEKSSIDNLICYISVPLLIAKVIVIDIIFG
jgi:hypothetical protein